MNDVAAVGNLVRTATNHLETIATFDVGRAVVPSMLVMAGISMACAVLRVRGIAFSADGVDPHSELCERLADFPDLDDIRRVMLEVGPQFDPPSNEESWRIAWKSLAVVEDAANHIRKRTSEIDFSRAVSAIAAIRSQFRSMYRFGNDPLTEGEPKGVE